MKIEHLVIIILTAIIVSTSYDAESSNLDQEGYSYECTELVYSTDPMIAMARLFGKKIGPQVKEDIREICDCFASKTDEQIDISSLSDYGANLLIEEQFKYFQTRQMHFVAREVRPYVYEHTKQCAPEFFINQM